MKKLIILSLLFLALKPAFTQCASDYVGAYLMRYCDDSNTLLNYFDSIYISQISPDQILIRNFQGVPDGILVNEDTIVANIDCNMDTFNLTPVSYQIYGTQDYLAYTSN